MKGKEKTMEKEKLFYLVTHKGAKFYQFTLTKTEARGFVNFFNSKTNYGKKHPCKAVALDGSEEISTDGIQ